MALKLTSLAVALAGTAVLLSAPAGAEVSKRGNDDLKKYCTGDYLNHCRDIDRDDPAMEQCFRTNWLKITENCRRAIQAYAPIKDVPRTDKK